MRALVLLACSGCSTLLGIDDLGGPPDGGAVADRPVDVVVPGSLRITGTYLQAGLAGGGTPIPNAAIELISTTDTGSTTTTDANGRFELVVVTNGQPLDGFFRATDPSGKVQPSETFFAFPLTQDTELVLQGLDQPSIDQLAQICGAVAGPQFPFFALQAVDATGAPVAGVTFNTEPPGKYCADTNGGIPQPGNNTSGQSGIVFGFEISPGSVQIFTNILAGGRLVDALPGMSMFVPIASVH